MSNLAYKYDDTPEPIEYGFPISDYYKDHIKGARTLTHTGVWWTAILLIEDPKTKKPFIGLYRWQKTKTGWKTRKRFTFNSRSAARRGIEIVEKFALRLD